FVADSQVVETVLAFRIHPTNAILHNNCDLVRECRIVVDARGNCSRKDRAVPVLVLQTLAQQSGPSGGPADHEALAPRITKRPDKVTDTLEAEHGIVDEEWNHQDSIVGVSRTGSGEACH